MVLIELQQDLFDLDEKEYYFAHCISADFAMGAGIAPQFQKYFGTKSKLLERYYNDLAENTYLEYRWESLQIAGIKGDCILVDKVFNLITKKYCYEKPTYHSLYDALLTLRALCCQMDVKKLAMPRIGCGLDRLDWPSIKDCISDIFRNMDIEITICYLN